MSARRGSTLLETALYLPVLFLLLLGMIELARVTYTYFTLHKILTSVARIVGTEQGVNFCDEADPAVAAAKRYAISGSVEEGANPLVAGLTEEMISIRIERFNAESEELGECECSITGCDSASGGLAPDFLVVSIPDGYPVRLNIPSLLLEPIPLRPSIRMPFGGT